MDDDGAARDPPSADVADVHAELAMPGASGRGMLLLAATFLAVGSALFVRQALPPVMAGHVDVLRWPSYLAGTGAFVLCAATLLGLEVVGPEEAVVVCLFGRYVGTLSKPGLRWINPLCSTRTTTLAWRNSTVQSARGLDAGGEPVDLRVRTTWRVARPRLALHAFDDVAACVEVATVEAARDVVSSPATEALAWSSTACDADLVRALRPRLAAFGAEVLDASLAGSAHCPEAQGRAASRRREEGVREALARAARLALDATDALADPGGGRAPLVLDAAARADLAARLMVEVARNDPALG